MAGIDAKAPAAGRRHRLRSQSNMTSVGRWRKIVNHSTFDSGADRLGLRGTPRSIRRICQGGQHDKVSNFTPRSSEEFGRLGCRRAGLSAHRQGAGHVAGAHPNEDGPSLHRHPVQLFDRRLHRPAMCLQHPDPLQAGGQMDLAARRRRVHRAGRPHAHRLPAAARHHVDQRLWRDDRRGRQVLVRAHGQPGTGVDRLPGVRAVLRGDGHRQVLGRHRDQGAGGEPVDQHPAARHGVHCLQEGMGGA